MAEQRCGWCGTREPLQHIQFNAKQDATIEALQVELALAQATIKEAATLMEDWVEILGTSVNTGTLQGTARRIHTVLEARK